MWSWGSLAERKGTHDHYNEAGLEVKTWDGQAFVLTGDAYMRPEDAKIVAKTVQISLAQFTSALLNTKNTTSQKSKELEITADTYNVCTNNTMPEMSYDRELLDLVLMKVPKAGLGEGLGQLERFRSELGPFIGVSSSLETSTLNGGFGPQQDEKAIIGSIEANLMLGLGLDGVMNKAGDGLAFIQFGWRQDSPTTSQFTDPDVTSQSSSVTSTIPGRSAYNLRMRLPFWLFPGDLVLAAPFLAFTSPQTLQRMAVTAGNGGLIPWQSGISTRLGRFQFVLGREVGVSFYGLSRIKESLVIPKDNFSDANLVTYRSTKWDFPFLEYQPTRTFSETQSAILKIQFSIGVDVPSRVETLSPLSPDDVRLKSVWYLSMRLGFQWRRYL